MIGRKVVKLSRSKVRKSKEEREEEEMDAAAAEWILKGGPEAARMMVAASEMLAQNLTANMRRILRKAEETRRKREMQHDVVEMKPKQ
jgi:hypothetical protein